MAIEEVSTPVSVLYGNQVLDGKSYINQSNVKLGVPLTGVAVNVGLRIAPVEVGEQKIKTGSFTAPFV